MAFGALTYANSFSASMFVFWALVVVIGALNRLLLALNHPLPSEYRRLSTGSRFESAMDNTVSPPPSRLHVWLARRLIYPATFGYRCAQNAGWCTIPPRVQSLTILAFITMNLTFCIHGYRVFQDNM
jgi:hypothetical protein